MKMSWTRSSNLAAACCAVWIVCGCGSTHRSSAPEASAQREMESDEEDEDAGEIEVRLDDTPPAVRQAIERELAGAKLEDIAKEQRTDGVVYEADILKDGVKWKLVVAEDGRTLSTRGERGAHEREDAEHDGSWRGHFDVAKASLAPTGSNRWLAVQPGRVLELRRGGDVFTITILGDTPVIDGVQVGVLEDRETKGGQLVEVSRNFLATDRASGDVYYFGEDVDDIRDGRVVSHESAWRAGVKGARFGLMMPGAPKAGDKFYQELAPGVAMDRVEIVSTDEIVHTPAGTFEHCIHMKETTPLESGVSHKWYAPGVGLIKDDDFELAKRP